MAKKGDWVMIHNVVLTSAQRAPQVPDDTKNVPLETWVKGFLQADGEVGQKVTIKTVNNRVVEGTLVEVEPSYSHSFGKFVPELHQIGFQLRGILFGGESNE